MYTALRHCEDYLRTQDMVGHIRRREDSKGEWSPLTMEVMEAVRAARELSMVMMAATRHVVFGPEEEPPEPTSESESQG